MLFGSSLEPQDTEVSTDVEEQTVLTPREAISATSHEFPSGYPDICLTVVRSDKGWTAGGKARVPLMLAGLLDVLHAYPGRIPDLDAVLSVADFPCVPK